MKKFLFAVVALMSIVLSTSCGKRNENPLIKGMVGEWHLAQSPVLTSNTKDNVDVYIEFKADNTFELYQRDVNATSRYKKFSGTYLITDEIVTGKYSDGKSWGATEGYRTILSAAGSLTMTNVLFPEDVSVYEPKAIPASVKEATRAEADELTETPAYL